MANSNKTNDQLYLSNFDPFQNFPLPSNGNPYIPVTELSPNGTPAIEGNLSLVNGDFYSPNYSKGKSGWIIRSDGSVEFGSGYFRGDITGATGTFSGTVTVGSLNIPDTTTASSFHVDVNGNTWWGANVASGYANANASILATGLATFKNVLVGGSTIQYQGTDTGVGTFGDGSDGAGIADGVTALAGASLAGSTYTLTRDVYYTSLTVSTGVTIKPSGYRIFGTGTLSLNGTATIQRNGNAGSAGTASDGTNSTKGGGTGGAALADGYLKGTDAGATGGNSNANGANTGNKTNSIGVSGSNGGAGRNGGVSANGTGGTAGTVTASNVKLIANWHLATLLDIGSTGATVKYDGSTSSAGGGGGGSDSSGTTGAGGGGGGSAGGILAIYFRNISVGASASITANGGNGGAGGNGDVSAGGQPGGGGGGGAGGNVILVYNTLSNSGTVSANGGTGGASGSLGSGSATAGTAGTAGFVRLFNLSQ